MYWFWMLYNYRECGLPEPNLILWQIMNISQEREFEWFENLVWAYEM
jgi:hypothetical protein